MATKEDKFLSLVRKEPSNLLAHLKWEKDNRDWLRISQKIAMRVLDELEVSGISRLEFCLKMGFSQPYLSRLLKGRENMTLETIAKFEYFFKTKIVQVVGFEQPKKQPIQPKKVTRPIK